MKTVTVDLRRSYTYDGKTYHPGKGVEVPQGLADALLLSPALADEKPASDASREAGASAGGEAGAETGAGVAAKTSARKSAAKKSAAKKTTGRGE